MSRNPSQRLTVLLLILSISVGCDQVTKRVAERHLTALGTQSFLDDTFRLEYAENPGAFLSLGSEWPEVFRVWLLPVATAAILAGFAAFLFLRPRMAHLEFLGLSLILGGGLGNLLDRVLRAGRVVDFLNVGIGPVRTGIFNLADAVITLGAVLVLAAALGLNGRRARRAGGEAASP
jgi:signal peptidase II